MFNPSPVVQHIPLGDALVCVIDDALQDPGRWVELARLHAGSFVEAPGNAYPGIELPMPDSIAAQCMAFFDAHLNDQFGLRGCERGHAKLAIATHPEQRLQPFQTIPHVDRLRMRAGQAAMASVLYLFEDERLGGTSFNLIVSLDAPAEVDAAMARAEKANLAKKDVWKGYAEDMLKWRAIGAAG